MFGWLPSALTANRVTVLIVVPVFDVDARPKTARFPRAKGSDLAIFIASTGA